MKKAIIVISGILTLQSLGNESGNLRKPPHEILSRNELELLMHFHSEQERTLSQKESDVQLALTSHMNRFDPKALMSEFLKLSQQERIDLLKKANEESNRWKSMSDSDLIESFTQWLNVIPGPPPRRARPNF